MWAFPKNTNISSASSLSSGGTNKAPITERMWGMFVFSDTNLAVPQMKPPSHKQCSPSDFQAFVILLFWWESQYWTGVNFVFPLHPKLHWHLCVGLPDFIVIQLWDNNNFSVFKSYFDLGSKNDCPTGRKNNLKIFTHKPSQCNFLC